MAMSEKLNILNTSVRTYCGLYSLNDIHKIAGGENKHRPNQFIRLDQTKELVAELERCPDVGIGNHQKEKLPLNNSQCADLRTGNYGVIQSINGGAYKGTWVCKELVYAYAMWISAKFHLTVIRAFDEMQNKKLLALQNKERHPLEALPLQHDDFVASRWLVEYDEEGKLKHLAIPIAEDAVILRGKKVYPQLKQALAALSVIDSMAGSKLLNPAFMSD